MLGDSTEANKEPSIKYPNACEYASVCDVTAPFARSLVASIIFSEVSTVQEDIISEDDETMGAGKKWPVTP
jgi:hypothetical protein